MIFIIKSIYKLIHPTNKMRIDTVFIKEIIIKFAMIFITHFIFNDIQINFIMGKLLECIIDKIIDLIIDRIIDLIFSRNIRNFKKTSTGEKADSSQFSDTINRFCIIYQEFEEEHSSKQKNDQQYIKIRFTINNSDKLYCSSSVAILHNSKEMDYTIFSVIFYEEK